MKKIIFSLLSLVLLFNSCMLLKKHLLESKYFLDDKYLYGELSFKDRTHFQLKVKNGMYFREAHGSYIMKGDTLYITSEYLPDTFKIDCYGKDTLNSIKISIRDFDGYPFDGYVLLDNKLGYETENGDVIINNQDFRQFQIITSNYLRNTVDTINLKRDTCNVYVVRRLNTYLHSNQIFFNKAPFLIKGKKLIGISDSILGTRKAVFKSR